MSIEDCKCDNILVTKKKMKCTCTDCQYYLRKFKNAEQTNSSKSVLIDMLQNELKKKENLYKDLIDEYEKLRFRYCTVVQEIESLKEVYKRMEDENSKLQKEKENNKKHQKELVATLKEELDNWKQQFMDLRDKIQPSNDLNQKIGRIEKLLQNQGITMIELVRKFLEELRNMNVNQSIVPKSCASTITNECGDTKQKMKELEDDKENLNIMVKKLTKENKEMKNRLNEKKQKLSECICVLEKNETNIKNLSEDVENIIKERNQYLEQNFKLKSSLKLLQGKLKGKEDQEKYLEDTPIGENITDGTSTRKRRNVSDTSFSPLKQQLNELQEHNRLLSDTIKILTDENQSNLEVIKNLTKRMNDAVNEKHEANENLLKQNAKLNRDLRKCLDKLKESNEEKPNVCDEEGCDPNITLTESHFTSEINPPTPISKSNVNSLQVSNTNNKMTKREEIHVSSQVDRNLEREIALEKSKFKDNSVQTGDPEKDENNERADFGRDSSKIRGHQSISKRTGKSLDRASKDSVHRLEYDSLQSYLGKSLPKMGVEENSSFRSIGVGSASYLSDSFYIPDRDTNILKDYSKLSTSNKNSETIKRKKDILDTSDLYKSALLDNIAETEKQSEQTKGSEIFLNVGCQTNSNENLAYIHSITTDIKDKKSPSTTQKDQVFHQSRSIGVGTASYMSLVKIPISDSDDENSEKINETRDKEHDNLNIHKSSVENISEDNVLKPSVGDANQTSTQKKVTKSTSEIVRDIENQSQPKNYPIKSSKEVRNSPDDKEKQSEPTKYRSLLNIYCQTDTNGDKITGDFISVKTQTSSKSLPIKSEIETGVQTDSERRPNGTKSENQKTVDDSIQTDNWFDKTNEESFPKNSETILVHKNVGSSIKYADGVIQTDNGKYIPSSSQTQNSNPIRTKEIPKVSAFVEEGSETNRMHHSSKYTKDDYVQTNTKKYVEDIMQTDFEEATKKSRSRSKTKIMASQTEAPSVNKQKMLESSVLTDRHAKSDPLKSTEKFSSVKQGFRTSKKSGLGSERASETIDEFYPRFSHSDSHLPKSVSHKASPLTIDDGVQTDQELAAPSPSYEHFRGALEDRARGRDYSSSHDIIKPSYSKKGHSTTFMESIPSLNIENISVQHDQSSGPDEISTIEESLQTYEDFNWLTKKDYRPDEVKNRPSMKQKSKIPVLSPNSSRTKKRWPENKHALVNSEQVIINKQQSYPEELEGKFDKENKKCDDKTEALRKKDIMIDKLNKEINTLRYMRGAYDRCLRHTKVLQDKLMNLDQKLKDVQAENKELKLEKEYFRHFEIKKQSIKTTDFSCDFKSCCNNYNQIIRQKNKKNLDIQSLENLDYDISGFTNIISTFKDKLGELEQEMCKKDCLILSLESCVDRNNEVLGDCEKEIGNIVQQNEYLRKKNEQLESAVKPSIGCQSTSDIEKKIADLVKDYGELLQEAKAKDLELEEIKQKYDKLCSCLGASSKRLRSRGVGTRSSSPGQSSSPSKSVDPEDVNINTTKHTKPKRSNGEFPKRKKKKCSCREKTLVGGCHKMISDVPETYMSDSTKESLSPPSDDLLVKVHRKPLKGKQSKTNDSCNCWKHIKTKLSKTRAMKKDEPSLVELMRKYSEKVESPYGNTDDPELRKKNENIKRLHNEKINLQLKLNSLQHDLSQMMKEQSELKSGITCLLSEIINKMKILTDAKDGVISNSSPGTVASEVLDSLTQLEQTLSTKKSCNCMSVIKSKYLLDQQGIARQIYQPLFNKFFCDYSSETKSNTSSVDIFDVTELEVEKDTNKSKNSCRC